MKHIDSIDYVRILACIFVVALHTNPLGVNESNFIHYNILCIAVPLFFLISLYLYNFKDTEQYLNKRITKLGLLYLVGTILLSFWTRESIIIKLFNPQWNTYWFILDLLLLTVALSIWRNCFIGYTRDALIFSSFIILLLPLAHDVHWLISVVAPWNFIPLIFLSVLITDRRFQNPQPYVIISAIAMVYEWLWMVDLDPNYTLPPYTRISVIYGATALFLYALRSNFRASQLVRLVSKNTLGIFFFHCYFSSVIPNGVFAFIASFCGALVVSIGLRKLMR